ncbi:hypothetical protein ACFXK0_15560 [Nocardia sp. NPDC059177]|uniref:hypothetical protein n=1 Tax=Nocardia sp. NPDC059177 TaxID=3346759 RepID=UPI003675C0F6
MSQDLDDINELLEDFTSELRQQNKAKGTIDLYARDVGYFRKYLISENLPPTLESLTRQRLGAYIEHTLNRLNQRTQKPVNPEYAHRQYRSLQQFCSSAGRTSASSHAEEAPISLRGNVVQRQDEKGLNDSRVTIEW